jgi:hypothetical protein
VNPTGQDLAIESAQAAEITGGKNLDYPAAKKRHPNQTDGVRLRSW